MTSSMCPPDDHGTLAGDLTVVPTQPRPGLVLVRVLGEVDMLTARYLSTVLHAALDAVADDRDPASVALADEPSVVCDLEGVTFFGATGLDTVAAAHEAAIARGVRLVVVASCRTVCRPFRLTALDRRITLTDTHPAVGRASALPGAER
ncbi:STAS domain-containing protein [Actinomycetospora sp. CA-101289]|uniref:STAS domain-containing protein n=1 Tax=Actinomycetospora sp. CA-101289 TaxID=3239893 RepID=UPI003D97821C